MPIATADVNTVQQLRAWADAGTILDLFTATESLQVRITDLVVQESGELVTYELEVVETSTPARGTPPVFGTLAGLGLSGALERDVYTVPIRRVDLGSVGGLLSRTVIAPGAAQPIVIDTSLVVSDASPVTGDTITTFT